MCIPIFEHISVVILQAKPKVELIIKPYLWRVIILNEHPNSDIEFAFVDDERILNVLLNHVLDFLPKAAI
jgi:hypothetical protein